jgi:hypothetical protein
VIRYLLVNEKSAAGWSGDGIATVERYLPSNYVVLAATSLGIVVAGYDSHGWTLDGYVMPRLSSGLIASEEVDRTHPALSEVPVERTQLRVLEGGGGA